MSEDIFSKPESFNIESFVGDAGVDIENEKAKAEMQVGEVVSQNTYIKELLESSSLPEGQKNAFMRELAHIKNEALTLEGWLKSKLDSFIKPLRRGVHIMMKGREGRARNAEKVDKLTFLIENLGGIDFADSERMEDELVEWIGDDRIDSVPDILFPADASGLAVAAEAMTAEEIISLSDLVELVRAANLAYRLKTDTN